MRITDKRLKEIIEAGHAFAHVVETHRNSSFPEERSITVSCPACGQLHYHGARAGERGIIGHKVVHCIVQGRVAQKGYYIIDRTKLEAWEK